MKKVSFDKKWDYENGFYLTSESSRIGKTLSQFDIFKKITNVQGHIFEFGVFKGSSLMRFAAFRDLLKLDNKIIYGFDNFGKFPKQKNSVDNNFITNFEKISGTGIAKKDLQNFCKAKKYKNIKLIEGDILDTLPYFLKSNKRIKISLIHIDVDVYSPTKVILESLFDLLSAGGIIMFDDYSIIEGETKAVNEYFKKKNIKKLFVKPKYSKTPIYFVKK